MTSSYHRSIYSNCCCELIHWERTVMIQLQQRMHQYLFGPDKNQKFMRILSENPLTPLCPFEIPSSHFQRELCSDTNFFIPSASLYSL